MMSHQVALQMAETGKIKLKCIFENHLRNGEETPFSDTAADKSGIVIFPNCLSRCSYY